MGDAWHLYEWGIAFFLFKGAGEGIYQWLFWVVSEREAGGETTINNTLVTTVGCRNIYLAEFEPSSYFAVVRMSVCVTFCLTFPLDVICFW